MVQLHYRPQPFSWVHLESEICGFYTWWYVEFIYFFNIFLSHLCLCQFLISRCFLSFLKICQVSSIDDSDFLIWYTRKYDIFTLRTILHVKTMEYYQICHQGFPAYWAVTGISYGPCGIIKGIFHQSSTVSGRHSFLTHCQQSNVSVDSID